MDGVPHGGVVRGSNWAKIRLCSKWLKKMMKMEKNDFIIRSTSNMVVSAKKPELIRILGEKMEKTSTIDTNSNMGLTDSSSLAHCS